MMLAGKLFRDGQNNSDEVLDSNDLERERGITILSKKCKYQLEGVLRLIYLIRQDTPILVVK